MKSLVLLVLFLTTLVAEAQLVETRYCGAPRRSATGDIIRRADVIAAFQKQHPCPSTGLTKGSCPGWEKDHVVPLACGGCDSVSNLQWFPTKLKASAGTIAKDRWERKVYASNPAQSDTGNCVNVIVQP